MAKEKAGRAGVADRVHYSVGDFNEPQLPANAYDIVFVHQAMHHVAKLEKLYRALLRTLKADGLLYLDEYVGPSRDMWTDANFASHRALYAALPARLRTEEVLPMPIQPHDPSEAIRSGEIVRELQVGFEIVARRDYGGNLLSTFYPFIRPEPAIVAELIAREKALLQHGESSYHAVIVARPKRGIAKKLASARYFVVPKVKRIGRTLAVVRYPFKAISRDAAP